MSVIMSILAHPDETSFSAALHREFAAEWERSARTLPADSPRLLSIDLYRDNFNPVMELPELRRHLPIDRPAADYLPVLEDCRELVLFFPDWWGAEPAILKGFFDRLFRQGIAYDRDDASGLEKSAKTKGLLTGCGLSLWICSDSSASRLSALREHYAQRFRFIADFCGLRSPELNICSPLHGSSIKKRQAWLEDCRKAKHCENVFHARQVKGPGSLPLQYSLIKNQCPHICIDIPLATGSKALFLKKRPCSAVVLPNACKNSGGVAFPADDLNQGLKRPDRIALSLMDGIDHQTLNPHPAILIVGTIYAEPDQIIIIINGQGPQILLQTGLMKKISCIVDEVLLFFLYLQGNNLIEYVMCYIFKCNSQIFLQWHKPGAVCESSARSI